MNPCLIIYYNNNIFVSIILRCCSVIGILILSVIIIIMNSPSILISLLNICETNQVLYLNMRGIFEIDQSFKYYETNNIYCLNMREIFGMEHPIESLRTLKHTIVYSPVVYFSHTQAPFSYVHLVHFLVWMLSKFAEKIVTNKSYRQLHSFKQSLNRQESVKGLCVLFDCKLLFNNHRKYN